ncbi:hypothetical protein [Iamia sp.]|uniref:hypothetical protein n=1 Tax=Iamia sp. TaxID=2722710 RepID=UPI002C3AB09A|nr:hypothetical protein [Iamia sp.]HXH55964.1 hypothetical protein [Iamia sp.]
MGPDRSVGGCTVATRSYLADARLAARSFVDHHPGTRFTILVVDGDHMPPAAWTHRDVELVTPSELGFPADELLTMASIYSPFEMACALKPLALRRVLDHAEVAIYVDGDVEVLAPFDELVVAATDHDVVLVPHVLDPVPRDGRLPDEPGLLGAGMYNGGLLAVRRSSGAFLEWWDERLRRDALGRPDMMMLADQRWLDFVPALFDHHILRDPTYDVAYWNLHERPTAWIDGQLCVVDRPVRCFHYSGLTDARPWMLSGFAGDRPRVTLADLPAVARQCRGWLARRRAVDAEGDRALGYRWARTARGVPLDHRSRTLVRDALLASEADPTGTTPAPPQPHAADGGEAWEGWLRAPGAEGGVGRYLQQVWLESPTVARRFSDVHGADRPAYLTWAASREADEAQIPDALRPQPEEADDVSPADPPPRPVRRPPRPNAAAQRPVAEIDRARAVLDGAPDGPPGSVGRVVDRLLAGRDRRHDEAAAALALAVAELSRRLADLSDRLDRTNDGVYAQELRVDELTGELTDGLADVSATVRSEAATFRGEADDLGRRLGDVETGVASARGDLDGALEQDRITAGILADAETRLADELDDLRLRVAKLAIDRTEPDDHETDDHEADDHETDGDPGDQS